MVVLSVTRRGQWGPSLGGCSMLEPDIVVLDWLWTILTFPEKLKNIENTSEKSFGTRRIHESIHTSLNVEFHSVLQFWNRRVENVQRSSSKSLFWYRWIGPSWSHFELFHTHFGRFGSRKRSRMTFHDLVSVCIKSSVISNSERSWQLSKIVNLRRLKVHRKVSLEWIRSFWAWISHYTSALYAQNRCLTTQFPK